MVTIEIDGKTIQAEDGVMLIEAADEAGINIPRFCYHNKLSIAASCRMCLVEVEKAAKPLPACSTPVTDGMAVHTRSAKAIAAQQGVMEFLLINHPLDCPICDQGGECELQDLAVGYGGNVSQFSEGKRVVKDKDIGPLIVSDMTRCIHCTRCVRFSQEIAGTSELGTSWRGEHLTIGTFVEKELVSEMSGNVIDICPVGALTSKPFRYSARPWELTSHEAIAAHDCIGSNINIETRRNRVMRVLPRDNEAINECWISDRDRFSYEGLNSEDRLQRPMIKVDGQWQETDWNHALEFVHRGLQTVIDQHGAKQVASLVSPNSTTEEMYLLQKLMRGLGSSNIDHRLRYLDFSDQERAPLFPWLGQTIAELETVDAVLLVGSNIRVEQPIAGHRLRKAALAGAKVMCVNPVDYEFRFPVAGKIIAANDEMEYELAAIAKALLDITAAKIPQGFNNIIENLNVSADHRAIAENLHGSGNGTLILGSSAAHYYNWSKIRSLCGLIAELSGVKLGYLSDGANSAGGWLVGAVPHRLAGGGRDNGGGRNVRDMFESSMKAYLLLNIEPELDCAGPNSALESLRQADFVVSLTPYVSEEMQQYADVLLPVSTFSETSGTFINVEGVRQSFKGSVAPPGETRPAWKVMRVLGNLFALEGFEYLSSDDVNKELFDYIDDFEKNNKLQWSCPALMRKSGVKCLVEVSPGRVDNVIRRAVSFANTATEKLSGIVRMNKEMVSRHKLENAGSVAVRQGDDEIVLELCVDRRIADETVVIRANSRFGLAAGERVVQLSAVTEAS